MDYSLYEAADFAADESYLRYYFKLNQEDVDFWQRWISNHPERLDVIMSADHLIALASLHLPEEEFQQELERITQAIGARPEPLPPARRFRFRRALPGAAAAAILALFAAGLVFYNNGEHIAPQSPRQKIQAGMIEKANNTGRDMKLWLEDSSAVTLEPGAVIRYARHFEGPKREVYLNGNACFEVRRHPHKPFYVYSNNLVTHVLGTSFRISMNKQQKQVEVLVRSGKVEVYEQPARRTARAAGSKGVILTPNQKVVYGEESRQFEPLLADNPLPVIPLRANADSLTAAAPSFVFDNAPLPQVLQAYEKMYGITIEVEDEQISQCHFSGDITGMSFSAGLEVICGALHATYEIRGTKVLVKKK